ncbi:histidine phosphatase family protein [Pseudomonas sp. N040]|uniref:histidine phosphatase family protein n=1 Tax=Pseudomonas sp. N040 TaxID=2785325 RepID=UPI0018A27EFB|nr:histidine phosphatase family protein [Pseudomonas sp. N040]MBF7730716.1 histidine phosphatase family protein [Pseudomonas sp. N040]MBW7014359.1 phosphoglycerate mutase family protein [Pseudomonas sp. N040]
MGSIYLIRHGQASFGADDYDVLSPLGFRQSEALGKHLAQLGLRFDRCLSGDLQRQQHTARTTLEHIRQHGLPTPQLEIDKAFNEFDADAVIRALLPDLLQSEPQALEVMRNARDNRAEFQRLFALLIGRWVSNEYDQPGLERWSDFVERVESGLQRLLDQADKRHSIAVFTSGGTITALLQRLTGVSADKAFELNWQIINTSLSRLKFRGSEVVLASFNSQVHLELLKAPELITYR